MKKETDLVKVTALKTVSYNRTIYLRGASFMMDSKSLISASKAGVVAETEDYQEPEAPAVVRPDVGKELTKEIDKIRSLGILDEEQLAAMVKAGYDSLNKIASATKSQLEKVEKVGRSTVAKLVKAVKEA